MPVLFINYCTIFQANHCKPTLCISGGLIRRPGLVLGQEARHREERQVLRPLPSRALPASCDNKFAESIIPVVKHRQCLCLICRGELLCKRGGELCKRGGTPRRAINQLPGRGCFPLSHRSSITEGWVPFPGHPETRSTRPPRWNRHRCPRAHRAVTSAGRCHVGTVSSWRSGPPLVPRTHEPLQTKLKA